MIDVKRDHCSEIINTGIHQLLNTPRKNPGLTEISTSLVIDTIAHEFEPVFWQVSFLTA